MEVGINIPKLLYQYDKVWGQGKAQTLGFCKLLSWQNVTPPAPVTICHSEKHLSLWIREQQHLRFTLRQVQCKLALLAPILEFHSLSSETRLIHFHRCMLLNIITHWPVQSLWERSPFVKRYYSCAMLLILRLLLVMTSSHTYQPRLSFHKRKAAQ